MNPVESSPSMPLKSHKRAHFLLRAFVPLVLAMPLSAGAVTAKVKSVGTYATGAVFVLFDRPVADCSASNRIDVAAGDASLKSVLAVAVTAYSTDASVEVRVAACANGYPAWSSAGDTYLYLTR